MTTVPVQGLHEHYDDYYAGPNAWREVNAGDRAAMIAALYRDISGSREHPSIIDIGCGEGAVAAALAARDFYGRLIGYDISSSGVAAAEGRCLRDATFITYDGDRVPAEDGNFDLAILSHVIEHVEYPRTLLREASRLARHVYVEVPLELHWRTPRDHQATGLGHINLYTQLSIRHLLQSTGLVVHKQLTYCQSPEVFRHRDGVIRGTVRWAIKHGLHQFAEPLALRLFTYHCSLIASSSSQRARPTVPAV